MSSSTEPLKEELKKWVIENMFDVVRKKLDDTKRELFLSFIEQTKSSPFLLECFATFLKERQEYRPIVYSCDQCDKETLVDRVYHTHPDLFEFEETAIEWWDEGDPVRLRLYVCVECRQGIPDIINFVKRKADEIRKEKGG